VKKLTFIAVAGLIGTPAFAADLTKAPAPAPVPYAAYNWTGFYGGLEIGGGWATSQETVVTSFTSFTPSFPPGTVLNSIDYSGVLGGIYGGYNYQINQFVVGIDGDYTWADLTGTGTDVAKDGDIANHNDLIDWIATVTGRLGYAYDNLLFFAKGGWAWAGFSGSTNVVSGTTGAVLTIDQHGNDTHDGWTAGGGIEWAFSQHVSFKVEYDYVKFDTANFNVASDSISHSVSGIFARSETSSLNMVKGGIALRY
jgi:outer membrane immunogenic protein